MGEKPMICLKPGVVVVVEEDAVGCQCIAREPQSNLNRHIYTLLCYDGTTICK